MLNGLLYYYFALFVFQSRDYSISCLNLQSYSNVFTNLPAGEYRIHLKTIFNCNHTTRADKIYFDLRSNGNVIKGNITVKIPFDDTIAMEINFAYRDPTLGWKDNAFLHTSPNACTMVKNIAGNDWPMFLNDLGLANANCPIAAGFYTMKCLDASKYTKTNFSKTFIYGTYKIRVQLTRKNTTLGCFFVVVELKRP